MAFSDHVKVLMGMDSQGFHDGLQKAEKSTKKFSDNFNKYFVGALGTAVIAKTTQEVIDFGASIGDLSTRLGASTGFLQALAYGAEQSGVKADGAEIAFQRFSRRTAEAKAKAGPLRDTLNELGIQFTDSGGKAKDSETLFMEFGDALANLEDPADKLRKAFQFLDTEGVALTQMFQKGAPTIKDFKDEAERLGLLMSDDTIKALQKADGTLNQLGRSFKVMVAQYLPPFLDKLGEVAKAIQKGIGILSKYSETILKVGASLASYLVAVKALQGGALVIQAFRASTLAVGGMTTAVKALSVAIGLNPFGVLVTGLTALGFVIKSAHDDLNAYQKEWENYSKNTIDKAKQKQSEFTTQTKELKIQIIEVTEELKNMGLLKGVPPTLKETHAQLLLQKTQLEENGKVVKQELEYWQNINRLQTQHIDEMKQRGDAESEIAKQVALQAEYGKSLAEAELKSLQNKRDQHQVATDLATTSKELRDLEFARKNGLEDLLKERGKEQVELDRTLQRIKALEQGGKDRLEAVKKQHEIEDKIVQLLKDGKMPMEEAVKLATKLVEANQKEEGLHDAIKKHQAEKVRLKDEEAKRQKIAEALQKELDLQNQAKLEVQNQLDILQLQAQGRDKEAQQLAERLRLEKLIKAQADLQGIKQADAIKQQEKRVNLEKDIELKKIDQNAQAIIDGKVNELAQKKTRDAVDKTEKKRILGAQKIKRWETEIQRLQDQGDKNADKTIAKLQQLKQRQIDLILDDGTKANLDQLEKKKLDIIDNHDLQMQALADHLQKIQNEELKNQANADARKQELDQLGNKIAVDNQQIVDDHKKEIVRVGDAVDKLANKQPVVTAQVQVTLPDPDPSKLITDILDKIHADVAKEYTLQALHNTIKGKFVNQ